MAITSRYDGVYRAFEAISLRYRAKPHWGKIFYASASQLAQSLPKLDDFKAVRQRLDPYGIFLNDYLIRLFELPVSSSPKD